MVSRAGALRPLTMLGACRDFGPGKLFSFVAQYEPFGRKHHLRSRNLTAGRLRGGLLARRAGVRLCDGVEERRFDAGGNFTMRALPTSCSAIALVLLAAPLPALAQAAPRVEEQSIDQLRAQIAAGRATSESITQAYLARIAAMDRKGPTLRAVIAVNPDALAEAREADARRKAGKALGPLDGMPVLVKDNIETKDPIATT